MSGFPFCVFIVLQALFPSFPRKRKTTEARNESAHNIGQQARRMRNRKSTFPALSTHKLVRKMPCVSRSVRNCLSSPAVDGAHACKPTRKPTSRVGKPIRGPACLQAAGWTSTENASAVKGEEYPRKGAPPPPSSGSFRNIRHINPALFWRQLFALTFYHWESCSQQVQKGRKSWRESKPFVHRERASKEYTSAPRPYKGGRAVKT